METKLPPKTIYLIPDGEHGWLWCDDPAPDISMDKNDAVKYVRVDKNPPPPPPPPPIQIVREGFP